jgi:ATP-binding cassette subfamily A (ABC1) protein 3
MSDLIQRQIKELDLSAYANVHAGKLSGGNKRKLSCAIALIGNPPIVLLDEPSTGVDPQAKRFMWTVISNISTLRKQSTVVLTTHSMEEAEALCPKMGIMVDGKFQCFGSAQHIKDKYADGFDIDLKIAEPTEA